MTFAGLPKMGPGLTSIEALIHTVPIVISVMGISVYPGISTLPAASVVPVIVCVPLLNLAFVVAPGSPPLTMVRVTDTFASGWPAASVIWAFTLSTATPSAMAPVSSILNRVPVVPVGLLGVVGPVGAPGATGTGGPTTKVTFAGLPKMGPGLTSIEALIHTSPGVISVMGISV